MAWKQCKLGDIADVTKLAGFEFTEHVVYSDEGNIIALRGLNIKNGQLILDDVKYIDGSNFSKLSRSKLFIDDIMFTYVGTVGEVAIIKENDRFYLAPNVSRIRVKSDDSPKFISHYMRTDNFKNKVIFPLIATSSQPALSMENIRKFTINIPISREEQDCLAKYFDSLDRLITLHQQKITLLTKLKKAMLEKMFPKKGTVIPEFRFSGFANAWEQRKLGEIITEYKETVDSDCTLPILTSSKTEGVILQEEHFGRKQQHDITGYNILPRNYCTYRNRSDGVDFTFNINKCCDKGIISKFYPVFSGKNSDVFFLSLVLNNSDEVVREIAYTCTGTGQKVLSFLDLQKMKVRVPSFDEQKEIATYFDSLDHLITLHQRRIDMLKKLKSACLSEMFI
ncbi:restriction endonuclease subunit S [Ligilactobacillus ruminis]|nr:restriction endonuclease subunit S [Ligilactobacillus ruminis]WDC81073.1 restriction endonuclease subunit S [Ligilactobacillus ruminis]